MTFRSLIQIQLKLLYPLPNDSFDCIKPYGKKDDESSYRVHPVIPIEHVPTLPVKPTKRSPIPQAKVGDCLDVLPKHIYRPIILVLVYGLRSSAVCSITEKSISGDALTALDKNDVLRQIPLDELLKRIISEALEYKQSMLEASIKANKANSRRKILVLPDNLFITPWSRTTLLKAAQKAWDLAGLEKMVVHEVRHTLGTIAGKKYTPGVVQAVMGHKSRKSAERYFNPNEEMAAEARKGIITEIAKTAPK